MDQPILFMPYTGIWYFDLLYYNKYNSQMKVWSRIMIMGSSVSEEIIELYERAEKLHQNASKSSTEYWPYIGLAVYPADPLYREHKGFVLHNMSFRELINIGKQQIQL